MDFSCLFVFFVATPKMLNPELAVTNTTKSNGHEKREKTQK